MINKKPYIAVKSTAQQCFRGWEAISKAIRKHVKTLEQKKVVVCIECYQGTYADFNLKALKEHLAPNVTCKSRDIYKDEHELQQMLKQEAVLASNFQHTTKTIDDYFDPAKLLALQNNIDFIDNGVVLIHGIGAHKIWKPDILIYSDMSRHEILQRFRRNDIANLGVDNRHDAFEHQHRWSYFIDWPICDKIKKSLIATCDYFLETNNWVKPMLAEGHVVRKAWEAATKQPFFTAKFFDPELWDGQMKKEKTEEEDFSWGFDCDIEQNNLLLKFNDYLFESPAINLVHYRPEALLGQPAYRKFGPEMPIRFEFVDSMDHEQLSLHVFPSEESLPGRTRQNIYQDNHFYVMDASPQAKLHLGLSNDVSAAYLWDNIRNHAPKHTIAQLLHTLKLKKHDHICVPTDVVYSKGKRLMAIQVSASPSVYQFNIYHEGGQPSPREGVDEDRLGDIVKYTKNPDNIKITRPTPPTTEAIYAEKLPGHDSDVALLQRIWFTAAVVLETKGTLQLYNLIEGEEAIISSTDDSFEPFVVHYAETFVIPAGIAAFEIAPAKGQTFGLLSASPKV